MNNNQTQESAAVRRANLHFRKETQAREVAAAWKDSNAQAEATSMLTAKLRGERLAREATARAIGLTTQPGKKRRSSSR